MKNKKEEKNHECRECKNCNCKNNDLFDTNKVLNHDKVKNLITQKTNSDEEEKSNHQN